MLKSFLFSIIFLFSLKVSYAEENQTCSSFFKSKKTQTIISALINSGANLIWENYFPSLNPVVLTDLKKNPTCAVILKGKKTSIHKLKTPLIAENGIYEFYPYSTLNTELIKLLKFLKIERALLMSLHDILADLSLEFPGGEASMSYNLIIHEGFHIFSQLGSNQWPEWVDDEAYNDRDELVQNCYEPNQDMIRQELRELIAAFKNRKHIRLFKKSIENFISLREQRYLEYPYCEDFEASWEMTEGTAEYLGWSESLKLFVKDEEYIAILEEEAGTAPGNEEFFYSLGALQLFSINEFKPKVLSTSNPLLGKERSSRDSIFNILKGYL